MISSKPFKVLSTPAFERSLAKISSKYPHFKKDFQNFKDSLSLNPEQGIHLGGGIYKVRLEITGKGVGKSYGARTIYSVFSLFEEVLLLKVYDKSYVKDLSSEEFNEIRLLVNTLRKQKRKLS